MDRNVLEISGSVKKMKREKTYREGLLAMIVATICALLNSFGGNLNLNFEDDPVLEEDYSVLRMIEQRLVDIIGSCIFNCNVTMLRISESNKQLVIKVDNTTSLCTVEYHLYLPTQTQVIPISPLERSENVKAILNREVLYQQQVRSMAKEKCFILGQQHPSKESDCIAFKQLKSKHSKCVSLGDRMINKSNKLERYISAFANKNGGQIYYGITDDGIVKGEEIKDQEEIVRKVTKAINKMIWCGGKLERGEHWNIDFVPVKDENMNEIPSLFVVIISVVPLPGGLFVQEPESYHVVQGRVERMSFIEWKRRFFNDIKRKAMIPSLVSRGQWSSVRTQKICHKVFQQLVKYQNDGDLSNFETFVKFAEKNYPEIQVRLAILGEKSACAYKKGQFEKAKHEVVEYEELLVSSETKDRGVFTFRAVYAKSAIARAEGNYQESYNIAQEGLQLAEIVPAGILTAWFYNHVAIVEKILSQQKKTKAEKSSLVESAQTNFIKALQHTEASSIEQDFSTTIADLQQRIHTFRAITILGDISSGANFREATPSDIEAAETNVTTLHHLVVQGYPVTSYRKTYHLFSLSDLRMCQWWQQRTKEKTGPSEIETLQSSQGSISFNFLKEAFDYATEAKAISTKFRFEELINYANKRLAIITEMIIKLKVSSLRLPKVNAD